jgi:hypothetical protein
MPRSIGDPSASVGLAKCGIVIFDIIEIDGAECGLRLLQCRARTETFLARADKVIE